jgi:subtilisin family serine protease
MKRNTFSKAAFTFCMGGMLLMGACQHDASILPAEITADELFTSEIISDKYIVVLDPVAINYPADFVSRSKEELSNLIFQQAEVLLQSYSDLDDIVSIDYVYTHSIVGFAGGMSAEVARKMQDDPKVKYVEQDQILSLVKPDKRNRKKPGGGGGTPPAQQTPWGITKVNGAASTSENGDAWIIDTGIDTDHPDLNVDASRGYNAFRNGKDGRSTDDGHGHGSHVSGTVAAIDNSIGVIGVAAGATVIPVKVLNSRGSGSNSGVIAGVDFVGAKGVSGDVANMSLGGGISSALDDAVVNASNNKGVIFCLAAGNDGGDANYHSPARANGDYVYTISAFDVNNKLASWSNWGNPPVDYSAPGVSIYSTYKGGGYTTMSGTSMACPHAAGVFLLGAAKTNGTVSGDPDGNPDVIIIH